MFFSRLRNCGFKKIWLRKHFTTLKYEDREKLMLQKVPDSACSYSACQIVLEKEVESLKQKRSCLADMCFSHNDTNETILFPMEPHKPKRGMFSGHNNQEANAFILQQQTQDFANVVNLGISREKLYPRLQLQELTTETMARKDMEKKERGRGTMNVVEGHDSTIMYLVMPSYANHTKEKSSRSCLKRKIICAVLKLINIFFDNIDFNVAFSNSKNIKQLIVRTYV